MDCSTIENVGTIVSPSTDKKIKSKIAAMRLKHGTPHFRDVLRKRFRDRVKDSRGCLVNRFRNVDVSQTKDVFAVIQQEVSNILEHDDLCLMDVHDEGFSGGDIDSNTISDQEHWLMQQYDLFMADDNAVQQFWEESQLVVCPVCKMGNLVNDAHNSKVFCDTCAIVVPARASISDIKDRIYLSVGHHNDLGCPLETYFFVSSEDSTLYAHCNACFFFDVVV